MSVMFCISEGNAYFKSLPDKRELIMSVLKMPILF
ncbi:hypothetical protein BSTP3_003 [Bacillus phage BSTP3]|nr:hypothetical protein BSTP3_003 [Bacillus phage BSTP3]